MGNGSESGRRTTSGANKRFFTLDTGRSAEWVRGKQPDKRGAPVESAGPTLEPRSKEASCWLQAEKKRYERRQAEEARFEATAIRLAPRTGHFLLA